MKRETQKGGEGGEGGENAAEKRLAARREKEGAVKVEKDVSAGPAHGAHRVPGPSIIRPSHQPGDAAGEPRPQPRLPLPSPGRRGGPDQALAAPPAPAPGPPAPGPGPPAACPPAARLAHAFTPVLCLRVADPCSLSLKTR